MKQQFMKFMDFYVVIDPTPNPIRHNDRHGNKHKTLIFKR